MKDFGKRYLVTGASGLFGAMAAYELSKKHQVAGIYNSHPVLVPRTVMFRADLRDAAGFGKIMDEFRPDVVLHAAALTDVDHCESHPDEAEAVNHDVARAVARACRERSSALVMLSTDAFFDLPAGTKANEETEPNLLTSYGKSKIRAERATLEECPAALVVRTNIYGWNALGKLSLAEWILDGLLRKRQLTLFCDVTYGPLLVNTLVRAVDLLADAGERGIFHVAAKESLTKLDFGRMLARTFGLGAESIAPISVEEKKFPARRSKNMALDVSKFEKKFPGVLPSVQDDLERFRLLLRSGAVDELKGKRHLPELR